MMHQPIEEVDRKQEIDKGKALEALEKLSDKFDGSIVLRRYCHNTLLCDTIYGRLLGMNVNNGGYRKFDKPVWAVIVKRKKRQLLGVGTTPEEAIAEAVKTVGGMHTW